MFPAWRLQLRRARVAVAEGRWEEAAAMLASDPLREFLPAKQLSRELAGRLVERARTRLDIGQSAAGWQDFNEAVRLGAGEAELDEFRRRESEERLGRVVEMLGRGDATQARQELAQMEQRNLGGAERRTWAMIAEHIETADDRAAKGDPGTAAASLTSAQRLLPAQGATQVARLVAERLGDLHQRTEKLHALDARLHAALQAGDWTDALAAAEALLELAPEHSAARQARHKAWQAVGMEVTQAYRPRHPGRMGPPPAARPLARHNGHGRAGHPSPGPSLRGKAMALTSDRQPGKRLVAWIDAVGAYLVCLGEEIVLGQPSADGGVDVPILADLSRRHAVIRRDGEAYVLMPLHAAAVDGRPVSEPTVLRDKCLVKLGDAVELRFRRPHALSATAVLEVLSHHRTEPAVKSIVLMSESCIFGPQPHSHVQCRDWTADLVLFRRGDELACRTHAPVEIDGRTCVGQAPVGQNCRIEGDEFALSLEEI
jgi:hypothetical protein